MGSVTSKSPLERRNTIARRSQRRTLHNLKPKIDNVYKEIKKFKGTTEDPHYVAIKNEIIYLKNDLTRRSKDLQPQVRNLFETMYKKVSEAEEALQTKLEENKDKHDKKAVKQPTDTEAPSEVMSNVEDNSTSVVDVHQEEQHLENSEDKRKTVELKFVKVIPEEAASKEVKVVSPMEKRKSILKVGVPVMPGAVLNEFARQSNRMTRQYDLEDTPAPATAQEVVQRIHNIVESLRQIEVDISAFVGKKHGAQYNKIRDTLNKFLIELNTFDTSDEYALDQIKICRNYVSSCLSFLDERASSDVNHNTRTSASDDDVFVDGNGSLQQVEHNFRMQSLLKNTAV